MAFLRFQVMFAAGVAALTLATSQASAQNTQSDSVRHRNDCRLAEQVLLHRQPANKRTWALGLLPTCPTAGRIAVEMLGRIDTDAPHDVEDFITAVSALVDRNLALAAADVAENRAAQTATRIQALRILYAQAMPGFPVSPTSLTSASRAVDSTSAAGTYAVPPPDPWVTDIPVSVGQDLTTSDVEQVALRMASLSRDSRAPEPVRLGAARVAAAFQARSLCPPGTAPARCIERLRANLP